MIVYLTTNKVDGRKYIGSTNKTYDEAVKAKYLGSQAELKSDIDKLGADKFTFEVIEQCNDINHCREREKYHHDLNDVAKSPIFYNKKHGHYGAKNYRYTGEQSKNLSRALLGIKRTATTKKLAGINLKGAERSQLTTAKIRYTKLKKQVNESGGIRMRGLSYEIRIQVYGIQLSYYYNKNHTFEDVRQSLRDHARPILKMYSDDIKMLEAKQDDIKIVAAPKEVMTQQGFTKVGKGFASQYCEHKFGKISVKYLGNFPTKFQSRMSTLFYWNRLKKLGYKRSVLIEDNLEYFRNKKR